MHTAFATMLPHVDVMHSLQIVDGIISSLIGCIVPRDRRRLNFEIEARHRQALYSGILFGVEAALRMRQRAALDGVVDQAVEHARAAVPDAIRLLRPTNEYAQDDRREVCAACHGEVEPGTLMIHKSRTGAACEQP